MPIKTLLVKAVRLKALCIGTLLLRSHEHGKDDSNTHHSR